MKMVKISVIIGIVGIISDLLIILGYMRIINFPGYIALIYFLGGWLFFIIGILSGVLGLKSSKKKLATLGIFLSLFGLIFLYMDIFNCFKNGSSIKFFIQRKAKIIIE